MIATRFMELRKRRGLMTALVVVNIGIPVGVPRRPAHRPRRRPPLLRAGRRLRHLHHHGGRSPLHLRVHRGGHPRLHGRVGRPHRGHVPPPGGDGSFAARPLLGPDSGGPGHHRAAGGRRLRHRLRRVRARRTDPAQLPERQRAGRPVQAGIRDMGCRTTPTRSSATSDSTSGRTRTSPGGPERPLRRPGDDGPGVKIGPGAPTTAPATQAQVEDAARKIAGENYADYSGRFLSPSVSLMVRSGLWLELYAAVGFLVGLGLASLMGQRTVPVILLIVLEVVLTPLLSHTPINHLVNLQRGLDRDRRHPFRTGRPAAVFGGSATGGARASRSPSPRPPPSASSSAGSSCGPGSGHGGWRDGERRHVAGRLRRPVP